MSPNSWFSQPVFIPGGNPESMNEPETNIKPGQLGIKFAYNIAPRSAPGTDSEGVGGAAGNPKAYKMVRTDSSMSVAPYDAAVAWWSNQATYVTTTSPTALGRGRIAGIYRCAVTPGNITCIQTNGKGLVKFVDAPTAAPSAAGLFVIPSATASKADCLAAGSAPTYPPLGRSAGILQGGTATAIVDLEVPDVY
jgi:hypothetical protein